MVYPEEIKRVLREENPEALFADGFDGALVGIARRCSQPSLAVYDVNKCIAILMHRDGSTYSEAVEHMDFNVTGGWHGEHTPLWFQDADFR